MKASKYAQVENMSQLKDKKTYRNNIEYRQKPKIQKTSARKMCRSHLNHKFFSESFILAPLNVLSKPMGVINLKIW